MHSNIIQLKREGLAAHKCGDFGSVLEAFNEEKRREESLPEWNVIVWEGAIATKCVRRSFSVPYLLEKIAQELDADECAQDRVLDRITVSIERVKK